MTIEQNQPWTLLGSIVIRLQNLGVKQNQIGPRWGPNKIYLEYLLGSTEFRLQSLGGANKTQVEQYEDRTQSNLNISGNDRHPIAKIGGQAKSNWNKMKTEQNQPWTFLGSIDAKLGASSKIQMDQNEDRTKSTLNILGIDQNPIAKLLGSNRKTKNIKHHWKIQKNPTRGNNFRYSFFFHGSKSLCTI